MIYEIIVGCDEEISSLIQSLSSLILKRTKLQGDLPRVMFLIPKQSRDNYREIYLQATLAKEQEAK